MILTNKTLEHFLKWKVNNKKLSTIEILDFKHLSVTSQNALIIEFFDSVGIYIGVYPATNCSQYLMFEISINDDWISEEENRQEATIQAIIKANQIYNERFK